MTSTQDLPGPTLAAPSIDPSADISALAEIGAGALIWHLAQVREGAIIGRECIIGRGAYVGPGVVLGERCKVQNHALLYEPARLGDGVFVGPAVVFTNDLQPRAVNPDGTLKSAADWSPTGVIVEDGASIGARAVCVAPLRIGRWAMVAAGAVVTRDVADFALVVGTPARQIGWVGRAGARLEPQSHGWWRCPRTGQTYQECDGALIESPRAPGMESP